jgi:hypothetical protein
MRAELALTLLVVTTALGLLVPIGIASCRHERELRALRLLETAPPGTPTGCARVFERNAAGVIFYTTATPPPRD